jgi:hypothetical protein
MLLSLSEPGRARQHRTGDGIKSKHIITNGITRKEREKGNLYSNNHVKKIHVFVKYSLILNSKKKKYSLILLFNNNLIKIKGRNGI